MEPAERGGHALHLLVVNGNTSEAMTETLRRAVGPMLPAGVTAEVRGVARGPRYIGTPEEVVEAAAAIEEEFAVILSEADGSRYSAAVLACFGEPGLGAVRKICPFPVTGMAEASAHAAMQLGADFAVATLGERWPAMLRDLYRNVGLDERCRAIATVPGQVRTLQEDPRMADRVFEVVEDLAHRVDPAAIVIGGAALVGVAAAIQHRIDTPLIDSFSAALGQAIALACTAPRCSPM